MEQRFIPLQRPQWTGSPDKNCKPQETHAGAGKSVRKKEGHEGAVTD